jgi:hypothetical protein
MEAAPLPTALSLVPVYVRGLPHPGERLLHVFRSLVRGPPAAGGLQFDWWLYFYWFGHKNA